MDDEAMKGDACESSASTSTFKGSLDGGMLDATGSGHVVIAAFRERRPSARDRFVDLIEWRDRNWFLCAEGVP